jgi:hypothetical protein
MESYLYNLMDDFVNSGGVIDCAKLHQEVEYSSIGGNFIGVNRDGDNIMILFSVTLSDSDKIVLDGLIASHSVLLI